MAPPTSSADTDGTGNDGHRLAPSGAFILRRLRDDGPASTVKLDPTTADDASAERDARTIRRLAADGYLAPTEPGSSDYRITEAGIAALEAAEAEWQDIAKRIGMQTGLADASGLKRIVDGMFPSLSVTQSFLASVDSSIARQFQTATKSILPTARATDQWATRVLEASGLGESLRRFSESVTRSIPRLNLDLSSVHYGWECLFLDPDEFNVPEFLAMTGIPLAGSTPPHVAQVLMDADPEDRESTLLAHRAAIYAQCRYVLEQDHADRAASATLALDALDLLEAGHFAGAQALASCALDPVSTLTLTRGVEMGLIPRPDGLNDAQYRRLASLLLTFHQPGMPKELKALQEAIPSVTERYQPTLRDFRWTITLPVLLSSLAPTWDARPGGPYSRHSTVHPNDPNHFNEGNAMRAVMTVVSLLWVLAPTKAPSRDAPADS